MAPTRPNLSRGSSSILQSQRFKLMGSRLSAWLSMTVIAAGLLGAWGAVEASDLDLAARLNKRGSLLFETGDIPQSKTIFTRMLSACGTHSYCKGVARFYLGRAALELGSLEEALDHLDTADALFSNENHQVERAKVSHVKGRVFSRQGAYADALRLYEQAESVLEHAQPREGRELAATLIDRAQILVVLRNYSDALACLDKAEGILARITDPKLLGSMWIQRGLLHREQQRYDKAMACYDKARSSYEQAKDLRGRARVEALTGLVNQDMSHFRKAERNYQTALSILDDLHDPPGLAAVYQYYSSLCLKTGDYEKALQYGEKALQIRREAKTREFVSETLNDIANVCLAMGEYDKALAYYQDALRLAEQIPSPRGEAVTKHNLSRLHRFQGNPATALRYSREAIALARQIGDRRLSALATLRRGNLFEYLGLATEARSFYEDAARIQREIGDLLFLSITLSDLANMETKAGDIRQAETHYGKALALRKEVGAPVDEMHARFALYYLERARYAAEGRETDPERDLELAGEQISLAEEALGSKHAEARLLLTYVTGRFHLHRTPDRALDHFQSLLSRAEAAKSARYAFLAQVGLGRAYEELDRLPEAEEAYRKAVDAAEDARDRLTPDQRGTFLHGEEVLGVRHVLPYEGLARVRMHMGKAAGSLQAAEFTKARGFADSLAKTAEGAAYGVPETVSRELTDLETKKSAKARQLERLTAAGETKSLMQSVVQENRNLAAEYERLKARVKREYPHFYAVRFPHALPVRDAALRDDEWLLAYDVTDRELLIYLVRGTDVVAAEALPVDRKRLEHMVRALRSCMQVVQVEPGQHRLRTYDEELAWKLGHILLGDVIYRVPAGDPITIVPDENLGLLPFEMLRVASEANRSGTGQVASAQGRIFLADRNLVSYRHSITGLTLARRFRSGSAEVGRSLVLADPVFSATDERVTEQARKTQKSDFATAAKLLSARTSSAGNLIPLDRLSRTSKLAEVFTDLFGSNADVYLGKRATKAVLFADRLKSYQHITIATHGALGDRHVLVQEPVLYFAYVDEPHDRDSVLSFSEVMDLKLHAEMVALTACQTGLGENIAGEGILGMGRAFQYAGAKSVLMSMWSVDEEASVDLVATFFRLLSAGESKLEALRGARRKIRADHPDYQHPFFWASFILAGEVD